MVNNRSRILAISVLLLGFITLFAQSVTRKGNTFIEKQDTTQRSGAVKTGYLYTDKNGVTDTIYLSKNGKGFIWKVSKKTGKRYRKYLPAITEEIKKK